MNVNYSENVFITSNDFNDKLPNEFKNSIICYIVLLLDLR